MRAMDDVSWSQSISILETPVGAETEASVVIGLVVEQGARRIVVPDDAPEELPNIGFADVDGEATNHRIIGDVAIDFCWSYVGGKESCESDVLMYWFSDSMSDPAVDFHKCMGLVLSELSLYLLAMKIYRVADVDSDLRVM